MSFDGEPKIEKKPEWESPERIKCAAIRYKDEYFTGRTHGDAWTDMTAKYPETVLMSDGSDEENSDRADLFLTNTGRFVDRKEALEIATKADQLINAPYYSGGILSSEDLKEEGEE